MKKMKRSFERARLGILAVAAAAAGCTAPPVWLEPRLPGRARAARDDSAPSMSPQWAAYGLAVWPVGVGITTNELSLALDVAQLVLATGGPGSLVSATEPAEGEARPRRVDRDDLAPPPEAAPAPLDHRSAMSRRPRSSASSWERDASRTQR